VPDFGVSKVPEAGHNFGDVLPLLAHGLAVHFQEQARPVGQKPVPGAAGGRISAPLTSILTKSGEGNDIFRMSSSSEVMEILRKSARTANWDRPQLE
jgi:hypothetical protein